MTENKENIGHYLGDEPDKDLPDFSTPEWADKIQKAKVKRGRPKATTTKISTTIRLDPDVIAAFKNKGSGWQSRINDALRKAAGLPEYN